MKPMERHILAVSDVESDMARNIIENVMKINRDDDEKEKKYKDFKREPIELVITSYGGSCYDGLGIYDVIQNSKTPVYTQVYGYAMSMGVVILLAGHKRFISKHSTLMFHDIATGMFGPLEYIKGGLDQTEKLRDMATDIICDRTNITREKLNEIYKSKQDWYITAQDAVKLGFADEII